MRRRNRLTIRVLLVGDQELLRPGFRMVLDAHPDIEVVAEAADGAAALDILTRVYVDVVVMDIRMPGLGGVVATPEVCRRGHDGPRVLIFTTFDLDEYVYEGFRAGANGFLLKDVWPPALVDAIRAVASGVPSLIRQSPDAFSSASSTPRRPPPTSPTCETLAPRDHEVLTHIAQGASNTEVANSASISLRRPSEPTSAES
jgi:DNA-binding NarL/FixJ family response regulator